MLSMLAQYAVWYICTYTLSPHFFSLALRYARVISMPTSTAVFILILAARKHTTIRNFETATSFHFPSAVHTHRPSPSCCPLVPYLASPHSQRPDAPVRPSAWTCPEHRASVQLSRPARAFRDRRAPLTRRQPIRSRVGSVPTPANADKWAHAHFTVSAASYRDRDARGRSTSPREQVIRAAANEHGERNQQTAAFTFVHALCVLEVVDGRVWKWVWLHSNTNWGCSLA